MSNDTIERGTDPAELTTRVRELVACCLRNVPEDITVSTIDQWVRVYPEYGYGPESDEAALFLCADGRWAVLEGWEDSTGHGCQCGAAVSFHATREAACRLGLSDKGRAILGLSLDGVEVPRG